LVFKQLFTFLKARCSIAATSLPLKAGLLATLDQPNQLFIDKRWNVQLPCRGVSGEEKKSFVTSHLGEVPEFLF
jgi:hypothetical protein